MKKLFVLLLVIALAVVSVYAQGGQEQTQGAKENTNVPQVVPSLRRYSIGTAGTAGSLYPMGVAMAETITKHVPGLAFTGEATAASVENIRNLTSGKLAMGISQSEIAWLAFNGKNDFAGKAATDLRSMFSTIYSYVQIFTLVDSPVKGITDLKGKAVAVGAAGSGGMMCAKMILGYYGLTFDDIKPQYLTDSEGCSALKDGKVAAIVVTHPLKSAALMDLTTSAKVKMISLADDAFYKAFPFWTRYDIPAGTYANIDVPVTVPISRVTMLTSTKSGLSDNDVYQITKAVWENWDEWSSASNSVKKQAVFSAATTEIPVVMALGAIKYFEEKGVKIDPSLYPPEYKK